MGEAFDADPIRRAGARQQPRRLDEAIVPATPQAHRDGAIGIEVGGHEEPIEARAQRMVICRDQHVAGRDAGAGGGRVGHHRLCQHAALFEADEQARRFGAMDFAPDNQREVEDVGGGRRDQPPRRRTPCRFRGAMAGSHHEPRGYCGWASDSAVTKRGAMSTGTSLSRSSTFCTSGRTTPSRFSRSCAFA